jgi:hypothetical protein
MKHALAVGSLALLMTVPAIAQAQLTGTYFGASYGRSDFKNACDTFAVCDRTDTAVKFYSGYQFGNIFGAEFGFVDLGTASAAGARDFSALGAELVGIAQWPVTQSIGIFGKVGGYYMNVNSRPFAGSGLANGNETSTDMTYGVGVRWRIAPRFSTSLEWQRYNNLGESGTTGQTDVNYAGVSLNYHF